MADRLGIPRPMATRTDQPEIWTWWAEQVRLAGTVAAAGGDIAELRIRAMKLDGSTYPWPSPPQMPV